MKILIFSIHIALDLALVAKLYHICKSDLVMSITKVMSTKFKILYFKGKCLISVFRQCKMKTETNMEQFMHYKVDNIFKFSSLNHYKVGK